MDIIKGRIKAISVSKEKSTKKVNVLKAEIVADFGIVGDAHAGNWHRQVRLLASESMDKMVGRGISVSSGDFAENITTEGIDLLTLSIGNRLKIDQSVELEITQLGKKCHRRCEIFEQVREGIFAKVTKAGSISVGDLIEVTSDDD